MKLRSKVFKRIHEIVCGTHVLLHFIILCLNFIIYITRIQFFSSLRNPEHLRFNSEFFKFHKGLTWEQRVCFQAPGNEVEESEDCNIGGELFM